MARLLLRECTPAGSGYSSHGTPLSSRRICSEREAPRVHPLLRPARLRIQRCGNAVENRAQPRLRPSTETEDGRVKADSRWLGEVGQSLAADSADYADLSA